MKKIISIFFITLLLIIISVVGILSTTGYETDKFNNVIIKKINENNKNLNLELKKIKFKFDIKNFSLFLETNKPSLNYKNLDIPIKKIKIYLDLVGLIKQDNEINQIKIISGDLNINELKKIVLKTKPSNLNSFIINKVSKGNLKTEIEIFLDNNQNIQNFIAKGYVKEMEAKLNTDLYVKNTNFEFFADATDILIKNINSQLDGISLKEGHLHINRGSKTKIKSDFNSEININDTNLSKYSPFFNDINITTENLNLTADLKHFLDISFDETLKIIDYSYSNKGRVNLLQLKFPKALNSFYNKKKINLKDISIDFNSALKKNNNLKAEGKYSFSDKDYQNFNIVNNFSKNSSYIKLDFNFIEKIYVDLINYKKEEKTPAKISIDFKIGKKSIDIDKLEYEENKNAIIVEKLKISNKNVVSLKKIKVNTYKNGNLNNDFYIDYGKEIKIIGSKYDANNLNKILNQPSQDNYLKKITKNITIDFKNVTTPLSKKLKNFKLLGSIEKGKFVKISSKGDFGNNKYLDISMKNDKKNKKKYLEIYSDLPQPLLSDYSFFKGLSGGNMIFTSLIEGEKSSSKLIIENFKVVNAPGVVKLLSLADFGGLADLAEGEGLSFDKIEINMINEKGFMKLTELYAVGPSISVLMDGYKERNGLTSLRGTLVPAKNLNRLLSKIPVIGDIIIPKEVGEGLFGVSFKMKGKTGEIKTTINPIKTLTPRFITKALEKTKKTK